VQQQLLLGLIRRLRLLLLVDAAGAVLVVVVVVVELVGDVGDGALQGVGRGPAPLDVTVAAACGVVGAGAADVIARHRNERRRHGHGDRTRLSAGSHMYGSNLLVNILGTTNLSSNFKVKIANTVAMYANYICMRAAMHGSYL